ncbi:MAG: hypothetical protein M3332_07645 [Actinomycetota bacterium]|nr:hypothetical protein [Actinomycetota bacterium]
MGVGVLDRLLAARYSAGASLRHLAKVTGLGWARLCCEIDAAGIAVRTGTEAAVLLQSLDSNDAEVICGLSSLSGILFDEFAGVTGRFRGEVLHAVHLRYLDPRAGPPR